MKFILTLIATLALAPPGLMPSAQAASAQTGKAEKRGEGKAPAASATGKKEEANPWVKTGSPPPLAFWWLRERLSPGRATSMVISLARRGSRESK